MASADAPNMADLVYGWLVPECNGYQESQAQTLKIPERLMYFQPQALRGIYTLRVFDQTMRSRKPWVTMFSF